MSSKDDETESEKYVVIQNEPKTWSVCHKEGTIWIEDSHRDNADDAYARKNVLNMSEGFGVMEVVIIIYLIGAGLAIANGYGGYQ